MRNRAMLEEAGLGDTDLDARANELRRNGKTVMFVAIDGAVAGLIAVAGPLRENPAKQSVRCRHPV